jgi:hypothetical protein
VRNAGDEVRRARPERREADARNARRSRRGLRHERRGGLVLCEDELESCLAEALDQIDDLSAGMPIHVPHAGGAKPISDRARDCHSHASKHAADR